MTHDQGLEVGRNAATEVFYMAGKQLAALARRLAAAGWPADVPVSVVSRAGWPDELASDHTLATLGQATVLHAGRPAVVVVGAGARKIGVSPTSSSPALAGEQRALRTPAP
jgi:uroporphyrin-III C-methyltransferase